MDSIYIKNTQCVFIAYILSLLKTSKLLFISKYTDSVYHIALFTIEKVIDIKM